MLLGWWCLGNKIEDYSLREIGRKGYLAKHMCEDFMKWYVSESLRFQVRYRWIHSKKQKICNQSIN